MNRINVNLFLRQDARVRSSDAGSDFAKYLFDNSFLTSPLELDVRDVYPTVLISSFFVNFISTIHQADPNLVGIALQNIKWITSYEWQSRNIERWMSPYKDKLLSDKSESLTDLRFLADRMRNHQDEDDSIMRELRMCPLWKAIQQSIEKSVENECGLMNKTGSLFYHRGTGAFSLTRVYAFPFGADDPLNTVRFCFDVSCWDDDREREVDASVMLDIPLVFLAEFDQTLFDEWVNKKHQEQRERNLENARDELFKLFEKYPELKNDFSHPHKD